MVWHDKKENLISNSMNCSLSDLIIHFEDIKLLGNEVKKLIELKDKILKDDNIKLTKIASKKETTNVSKNEAVLALKVLGYTTTQINEAIEELDIEGLKVEEIIKKVLAVINKR